jgi:hypothetical protein
MSPETMLPACPFTQFLMYESQWADMDGKYPGGASGDNRIPSNQELGKILKMRPNN